jgi:integrase/recombinase XerD
MAQTSPFCQGENFMLINPSRVRVPGPLAAFAVGFAAELARQGYRPYAARNQMRLLAHLSRWLARESHGADELRTAEVERFQDARRAAGHTFLLSTKAMRPILDYLRGLEVVPPASPPTPGGPVEEALERYRGYLTIERGLGSATAHGYVDAVRPFLQGRILSDGSTLDLGNLTPSDVISFVVARCPGQGRSAAKLTVTALRSLLGFLHVDGVIGDSLVSAVPSVACRRLAGLPKGLDPDQVRQLLASCDSGALGGRRDLAVLTMLVRLGLRSGEVAGLRLDDIDWRAGEIVVRGKANRTERLPLPTDVGGAVAAYLRQGRPASAQGRTVFVRILAPHRALTSAGVTQIVAAAARRAGLGRIHAHRLRHTAATRMLRAGASLPEVGQLLRHRRTMTTAIYAKVNREALRTIARPWPGERA